MTDACALEAELLALAARNMGLRLQLAEAQCIEVAVVGVDLQSEIES